MILPFTSTPAEYELLLFSIVSRVRLSNFSHSNRCVMTSHCDFNLPRRGNEWCWESFYVLICHLCIFFSEISTLTFCPFCIKSFVLLSILGVLLYFRWNLFFRNIWKWFGNIFLWKEYGKAVCHEEQKLFILIMSTFIHFFSCIVYFF